MAEIQRNNQTQMQVATIAPRFTKQIVGSVGTTKTLVSLPGFSTSVLIHNTHATANLYLYLRADGETWNTHYKVILPGDAISLDVRVDELQLKGQAASVSYEVLATLE